MDLCLLFLVTTVSAKRNAVTSLGVTPEKSSGHTSSRETHGRRQLKLRTEFGRMGIPEKIDLVPDFSLGRSPVWVLFPRFPSLIHYPKTNEYITVIDIESIASVHRHDLLGHSWRA